MTTLKRLEQLESHPQVREAEQQAHAQHLIEELMAGKLDVRDCTDDELSAIAHLLPSDDDLDVTQLTDEELEAIIAAGDPARS